MLRSVFGQSAVLRSAFVFSAAAAASGVEAAAAATHQQASETDASSTAAALWQQHSSGSGAAATHSADASNGSSNALMLFTNSAGSDSAAHEYDSTGSGGYVGFTGGFGPRHLAEVAIVPENGSNNTNTLRTRTALDKARDVDGDAAAFPPGLRAPSAGRRPVITKARRIRLAAAASQAAEVLQAVGTPATALLHSQRVQQLQAEEALLNASLQRLKAERDLAKVRHTYDEELHNFQRGVEQREHNVLLATCPTTTKKKKPTQLAAQTDPVVSYSQESGEGEMGGMADGELLGMTATADAEAAAAAAAAAGLAKHKKKQSVVSARAKLQRHSRIAQTRGAGATAVPIRRVASRLTAKATTARAGSNVKARAASQPAKASQKPKRKAATRTTPAAKKAMAAKSKPTKAPGRGKGVSPAPQKQSGSVKKKKEVKPPVTTKQLKKKTQHKVAVAAAKPKATKPAKASKPAQPKKKTKSAPAAKKQTPAAKKRARPTASTGKQTKKSSKK